MSKKKIVYVLVCHTANDINEAINNLRETLNEHTTNGYDLQGGVSIAISPDGMFYAAQTLIKECEENGSQTD